MKTDWSGIYLPLDHRLVHEELRCILVRRDRLIERHRSLDYSYAKRRTIRMENFTDEFHFWRTQWIITREMKSSSKYSEFKWCTIRSST
jgi:hypothetical protein